MIVNEECEQPKEGNTLIVDIEVEGQNFEMKVLCTICGGEEFWLAEDHSLLYCSKCRTMIAKRVDDMAMMGGVSWKM